MSRFARSRSTNDRTILFRDKLRPMGLTSCSDVEDSDERKQGSCITPLVCYGKYPSQEQGRSNHESFVCRRESEAACFCPEDVTGSGMPGRREQIKVCWMLPVSWTAHSSICSDNERSRASRKIERDVDKRDAGRGRMRVRQRAYRHRQRWVRHQCSRKALRAQHESRSRDDSEKSTREPRALVRTNELPPTLRQQDGFLPV